MTTIYQRLSPLGFAEWLEKKLPMINCAEWLQEQDKEPIDSYQRTSTNALAFRWLREEKDLECNVTSWTKNGVVEYYYSVVKLGSASSYKPHEGTYISHPEAEIACLRKLIEIVKEKK